MIALSLALCALSSTPVAGPLGFGIGAGIGPGQLQVAISAHVDATDQLRVRALLQGLPPDLGRLQVGIGAVWFPLDRSALRPWVGADVRASSQDFTIEDLGVVHVTTFGLGPIAGVDLCPVASVCVQVFAEAPYFFAHPRGLAAAGFAPSVSVGVVLTPEVSFGF